MANQRNKNKTHLAAFIYKLDKEIVRKKSKQYSCDMSDIVKAALLNNNRKHYELLISENHQKLEDKQLL